MSREDWRRLTEELNRWGDSGRRARIWWRDDDAVAGGTVLDRLFTVAGTTPLALAVVPGRITPSLSTGLAGRPNVRVLPHGWQHTNHQPPGAKRAEFGDSRRPEDALAELKHGDALLADLFGDRYRSILVPPWNRIAPSLADQLYDAGFLGLSTFNDRPPGSGLWRINTHVDVLDWAYKKRHGQAVFVGEQAALGTFCSALTRRRTNARECDPEEPVGLLTHHLEHDEATWAFLERLTDAMDEHPAVDWVAPEDGLTPREPR